MTVEEFIKQLQQYDPRGKMRVLIQGRSGEYWSPIWEPVDINYHGEEPLSHEAGFPKCIVLQAPYEAFEE